MMGMVSGWVKVHLRPETCTYTCMNRSSIGSTDTYPCTSETCIFHHCMTLCKDLRQALICKVNVRSQSIKNMVKVKLDDFQRKT